MAIDIVELKKKFMTEGTDKFNNELLDYLERLDYRIKDLEEK